MKTILIVLCALWAQLAYGQIVVSDSATLTSTAAWTSTFQPGGATGVGATADDKASQIDVAGIDHVDYDQTLVYDASMPFQINIDSGAALSSSLNGEITFPNVARITSNFNLIEITLWVNGAESLGQGLSLDNLEFNGQSVVGSWSELSPGNGSGVYESFFVSGYGDLPLNITGNLTIHEGVYQYVPDATEVKLIASGYQGTMYQNVPEPGTIFLIFIGGCVILRKRFRRR